MTIGDRAAASLAAPSTSNAFFLGFTERGPVDGPIYVVSMTDVEEKTGERLASEPLLFDALEAFFKEGGSNAYIGRVSPAAAVATKTLADTESKKIRLISAKSPGSWGNNIKVAVTVGGGKATYVVKYNGAVKETSPALATLEEEIAWAAANSNFITIAAESEGSAALKTQEVTLSGGTYAPGSVTNEEILTALNLFTRDLGPGQLAFPGNTAEAVSVFMLEHCAKNNRRAILDVGKAASAAEVVSRATPFRGPFARYGACMAQWFTIPGISPGTTRSVPGSGVLMGRIALTESEGNNPNVASAGKRGRLKWAIGLVSIFTEAQRGEIDEAGAIGSILVRGVPTIYGDVTLVNQTTEPNWQSFASSRLAMGIAAEANVVLEDYDFEQIDGHGYIFKKLQGDLEGEACMPFYLANSLYGQTPAEAFVVNTGPDVNTPQSIADEEIKAQIAFRASPHGQRLEVEVVKVPITEGL